MNAPHSRGFTLIEIVLVIALVSILAGLGLRLPYLLISQAPLGLAADVTLSAIHRAQALAATQSRDSGWGVRIASASATIFRGDAFSSRDEADDDILPFDTTVTVSGSDTLLFAPGTGMPAGPYLVSIGLGGIATADITINSYGTTDATLRQ